jgi:hypothetical protein
MPFFCKASAGKFPGKIEQSNREGEEGWPSFTQNGEWQWAVEFAVPGITMLWTTLLPSCFHFF